MTALRNRTIPHTPASPFPHDAADLWARTPEAVYQTDVPWTNQDLRPYDGDGPTMRAKVTLLVIVVCGIGVAILWWRLGRPL